MKSRKGNKHDGRAMNPGIVFLPDETRNSLEGIAEAFDSFFQFVHLYLNILSLGVIQSEAKNLGNTHFMHSRFFLPTVV